MQKNTLFSKKHFLWCIPFLALCISFIALQEAQAQKKAVAPYNLSKAPQEMHGLSIPDFLAFATDNKEKTPLSAVKKQGFFSGEISYEFDLQEPYFTKYHGKVADYARLLESQGFVFNAGWEGYYHFDKVWQGKYVMVTVGTYGYDTSGIMVSITLTKERYSFPPHHTISPYAQ